MATRALSRAPAAALALLAVLALPPACPAAPAAEERKVWRALTDGEPRGAAKPPRAPSGSSGEPFPSQLALALIVAAIIAAILAVGAHQARRRTALPAAPPPPEAPEPEPGAGSHVEELWRTHLQRRRPSRSDTV